MIVDKFDSSTTPTIAPVNADNVPSELKTLPQWCLWKYWWNGKKWTKPPVNVHGQTESHTTVCLTFEQAIQAHRTNPHMGIGFSIRESDPFCGLDFDNVLDPEGKLLDEYRPLFEEIPHTLIEVSPSGSGLRAFGLGNFDNLNVKTGFPVEAYSSDRYLTVTGQSNGTSGNPLQDLTAYVEILRSKQPKTAARKEKLSVKPDYDITTTIHYGTVIETLPFLPNEGYQEWLDVGMILHNEFLGADAAFELWVEWSVDSPTYNLPELVTKWESFGKGDKKPLTIGTLYKMREPFVAQMMSVDLPAQVWDVSDILEETVEARRFVIEPLFLTSSFNMVHAPRGLGKTRFCMSLGLSIACGKPFLGWTVPVPKKVLYIDGELSSNGLKSQVHENASATGLKPGKGMMGMITPDKLPNKAVPNLSKPENQEWLAKHIEAFAPEVIVFDSLSTIFHGLTESQDSWEPVQSWMTQLRSRGMCVILVHHDNKSGLAQAGFSNKEITMDEVIHLTPADEHEESDGMLMKVEFTKHRNIYGDEIADFNCGFVKAEGSLNRMVWMIDREQKPLMDTIKELALQGYTDRAIEQEIDGAKKKSTINNILKKMVESGELEEGEVKSLREKRKRSQKSVY